jgi:hypothetical protein
MLAAAAFPASLSGQEAHAAAASPFVFVSFPPESDDPAYMLYRRGYSYVLTEQWEKARKAFAELRQQYPASPYADDAAYWNAVSWKRTNREKSATLYRALLREYPQSPYVDDAVADLRLMEMEQELARVPRPPAVLMDHQEIRVRIPQELRRLREEMAEFREQQQTLVRTRETVILRGDTLLIRTPAPFGATRQIPHSMHADPAIQIRIQALLTLTDAGDSKVTSKTLRDVVLDTRQPVPVRMTAVYSLGSFESPENAAALLDVARADTNVDIQRTAIQMFAQSATDKSRAADELIALFKRFDTGDAAHDPRLGATLYSIAATGDERATGFLADIARTHRDEGLRSSAVFYLGSMGTERSRAALIRVLRGE